jgi:hypothetical protein
VKTIKIKSTITREQLLESAKEWDDSKNVALSIPEILSKAEIEHLFLMASQILPSEIGFCILHELAEKDEISQDLLSKIISIGDRGCIESVCLRKDLNPELRKLCKEIAIHKNE